MTRLLLILSLTALACGTPLTASTVTPTPSEPAAQIAPAPTPRFIQAHIVGCWNVRETPGGLDVGEICNRSVIVYAAPEGGWYQLTVGGWICGRAFGREAMC